MSRNREEGLSIGQEKELLDKLTNAGISAKEAQAIISSPDNALASKLVKIANEYAKDTEAEYGRWFDNQLYHLARGRFEYSEGVINLLREQKQVVLREASALDIAEGNIPFIPVVPREFRTAFDQFYELGIPTRINLTEVEYTEEVPKVPYYIFDVDYHGEMCPSYSTLEDAHHWLQSMHQPARSGLTDVEIAALKRELDLRGNYNTVAHLYAISAISPIEENGIRNEYTVRVGDGITGSGFGYVSGYTRIVTSCAKRIMPNFGFRGIWRAFSE